MSELAIDMNHSCEMDCDIVKYYEKKIDCILKSSNIAHEQIKLMFGDKFTAFIDLLQIRLEQKINMLHTILQSVNMHIYIMHTSDGHYKSELNALLFINTKIRSIINDTIQNFAQYVSDITRGVVNITYSETKKSFFVTNITNCVQNMVCSKSNPMDVVSDEESDTSIFFV